MKGLGGGLKSPAEGRHAVGVLIPLVPHWATHSTAVLFGLCKLWESVTVSGVISAELRITTLSEEAGPCRCPRRRLPGACHLPSGGLWDRFQQPLCCSFLFLSHSLWEGESIFYQFSPLQKLLLAGHTY